MFTNKLLIKPQSIVSKQQWVRQKQSKQSAIDMAYRIYGPGVKESREHILLLHGMLGCKKNWHVISEMIIESNKNICVIAADARNHGDSPHTETHTYNEMSLDVLRLLDKLSLPSVHILGHSMGGRTAMTLALNEPSKVQSLVVVDISPLSAKPLNNMFFTSLFNILAKVDFQGANNLDDAKITAHKNILKAGLINRTEGLLSNITKLNENEYGWKYNLPVLTKDFDNLITLPSEILTKQYKGPTFFIMGGRSNYVPDEDIPGILRLFPNADFAKLQKLGHYLYSENPQAFIEVLKKFLDKVLKEKSK